MITNDLIKMVESGSGPDRKLDAMVHAAIEGRELREDVNWQNRPVLIGKSRNAPHDECVMYWIDIQEADARISRVTGSLDCVIELIQSQSPREWWQTDGPTPHEDGPYYSANVGRRDQGTGYADASSPARALLCAALRAYQVRQAKERNAA